MCSAMRCGEGGRSTTTKDVQLFPFERASFTGLNYGVRRHRAVREADGAANDEEFALAMVQRRATEVASSSSKVGVGCPRRWRRRGRACRGTDQRLPGSGRPPLASAAPEASTTRRGDGVLASRPDVVRGATSAANAWAAAAGIGSCGDGSVGRLGGERNRQCARTGGPWIAVQALDDGDQSDAHPFFCGVELWRYARALVRVKVAGVPGCVVVGVGGGGGERSDPCGGALHGGPVAATSARGRRLPTTLSGDDERRSVGATFTSTSASGIS